MDSLSKNYWRVRAGQQNSAATDFYKNNYIGIGFNAQKDLTHNVPDTWQEFRTIHKNDIGNSGWFNAYILHRFIYDVQIGDIVITPFNKHECIVGEIINEAYWIDDKTWHHHRRNVKWSTKKIKTEDMSETLAYSIHMRGTMHSITKYAEEIEHILTSPTTPIATTDKTIGNPIAFALEQHLELFLVRNWNTLNIDLVKNYDIYTVNDDITGEQFPTDTGCIDILAISKDKKNLLVIELKRGRASDSVVGQIQRYMAYIQSEIATQDQVVKGAIIAFDNDKRIKRALQVAPNIELYTYSVSFSLQKADNSEV